jgi:Mrp family chromosome partitioning ATPase
MGERFGRPVESEPDTPGLYDVLSGTAQLDSAMSPGPVDGLSVLPSGTWGEQAVEDLLRRRFESVMASALFEFEAVVVLGPPLEAGDDARVMAVDGALLLAMVKGQVSANALRSHADRIRAAGGRLLGVVLVGRRPTRAPRPVKVPA